MVLVLDGEQRSVCRYHNQHISQYIGTGAMQCGDPTSLRKFFCSSIGFAQSAWDFFAKNVFFCGYNISCQDHLLSFCVCLSQSGQLQTHLFADRELLRPASFPWRLFCFAGVCLASEYEAGVICDQCLLVEEGELDP